MIFVHCVGNGKSAWKFAIRTAPRWPRFSWDMFTSVVYDCIIEFVAMANIKPFVAVVVVIPSSVVVVVVVVPSDSDNVNKQSCLFCVNVHILRAHKGTHTHAFTTNTLCKNMRHFSRHKVIPISTHLPLVFPAVLSSLSQSSKQSRHILPTCTQKPAKE